MNLSLLVYFFGVFLEVLAGLLGTPALVGLIYREQAGWYYLACALGSLLIGFLLTRKKPKNSTFYEREGLVICSGSWILMSLIGAIPLTLSGDIPNYLNAMFEVVSGFTTTGASILSDVEHLTHAGLFWRSFTHLVGGMGILVFMLTIIPAVSGSTIHLMRAESPGPSVGKIAPKMRTTALYLYGIYLGITLLLIILLMCGGHPLFDSMLLAFGTAGTGGFGILNDSFASYSTYTKVLVSVFMLLYSINFNVYFLLLMRKFKTALKSEELHVFLALVVISLVTITINIRHLYSGLGPALTDSLFQVAAIISTTGFSTANFDTWPLTSKIILVSLMFVGACAGSTGGGIKLSRFIIWFKAAKQEVRKFLHPNGVTTPTFESKPIDKTVLHGTLVYLIVYWAIFLVSLLAVSFDKLSFSSAFTGVLACLNNIGPGLAELGPTHNFGFLNPVSKIILMFDMLAGRLELYPMLVLLLPGVWKGSRNRIK